MGLFDFFKRLKKTTYETKDKIESNLSQPEQQKKNAEQTKETLAGGDEQNERYYADMQCPYCQYQFEKPVTRKRTCPSCKNTMVVRTHYATKRKMILTEEQLAKYEREANKYYAEKALERMMANHGLKEEFLEEKRKKPNFSSFDIAWGFLNKKGIDYAHDMKWGLFRNTRLDMAELLRREKRYKESLLFLLEVCYYDINGVTNTSKDLIKEYPPFRPEDMGFLAPGVIGMAQTIIEDLNLSPKEVKELFISHNSKVQNSLIPLSPEKAWEKIEKELFEEKGA
jgi:hypothetical protein